MQPERVAVAEGTDPWQSTWHALGVRQPDHRLHQELLACHAQPHRKYHTLRHLSECFANFELLRAGAQHPGEVGLALWFHDAIYDVRRHDNEERSAAWARNAALAAGLAPPRAERIHALVLATRHAAPPQTIDEKILVDVDLSILGAPRERFDEYERQVREEYAFVPGFLFRRKRCALLEELLRRRSLYHTAQFSALFEARARDNLHRSIASLGGRV